MTRISEFIKSILAGIMISVGGMIFLACDNKYAGAFLFSVGLVTVVAFGLNLYTGKIGYVFGNDKTFLTDTLLSVVGNLVGCVIAGVVKSPIGNVVDICAAKLTKTPLQIFVDAILCGLLIYICVDIFKKRDTFIGILLCIPTFILAGFEHSVADMFYFINARVINKESILFIIIVALGNAVGSWIIPLGLKLSEKCKSK